MKHLKTKIEEHFTPQYLKHISKINEDFKVRDNNAKILYQSLTTRLRNMNSKEALTKNQLNNKRKIIKVKLIE